MTRAADDFAGIREAMDKLGLDGDNGAELRRQQKQAQSIDRELNPYLEGAVGVVADMARAPVANYVPRYLSQYAYDDWKRWGHDTEVHRITGGRSGHRFRDPDTDTSHHFRDPDGKTEAWQA